MSGAMQETTSAQTVYVEMINLERDAERRAHMTRALAEARVDAHIPAAFDLRTAPEGVLDKYTSAEGPWGQLPDQDRACTISHMRSWQRFLDSDATHCLILEDDIHISSELHLWLDDLGWWPEDADVVKIERWRGRAFKVLLQRHSNHLGRHISRLLSRHVGGAGYMLTRTAARKLIDSAPYGIAVDNLLFNQNASAVARSLKLYQVHPALITQGNEPPNRPAPTAPRRIRPTGWALVRQKAKRGYYEVAYPLSSILKLLGGRAQIKAVDYKAEAMQ